MPDYAGLIKFPTGGDIYGGGSEPQWWKDLAVTTSAEIEARAQKGTQQTLTTSDHLDNIREHGYYQIPTPAIAEAAGAPVASVGGVMVESSGYSHGSVPDTFVRQTMWEYRTNAKMERTGFSNGEWSRWAVGVLRDDIASGGVEHLARVADYTNRAGGTVFTGGVGAVAFTFDHGLTKFAANNLPQAFLDRGWTFGLALNSRTMTLPENAGATVAQVKSWSKAEIWNHGATHSAQTTEAGVYDEIVNGKAEIETMFERDIHGYIPAGTGPVGLDGFDGGLTPESWGTYAGQLILRHHALTTGYLGSGVRPLDGQVRQGVVRWTMDSMTLARVKLEIDNAVAGKTGAMFMLHPSRLDSEGFMSTATLLAAMDYAKGLEEQGRLRVLAPSELMRASSAPSPDDDWATAITALNAAAS